YFIIRQFRPIDVILCKFQRPPICAASPGLERLSQPNYDSEASKRLPPGSPIQKRENDLIALFIFLSQWGRGRSKLRYVVTPHSAMCALMHLLAILCIPCNSQHSAKAYGLARLEPCLHTSEICKKNGHKARRREGDKCISFAFFIPEQISSSGFLKRI
ncbi:hypothetical protein, partial [Pseudomonas syringae]|uniref:hypothetical protein n=1 Tax=Pseudomonas syringae TaxID=317 RepID=UPI001F49034D